MVARADLPDERSLFRRISILQDDRQKEEAGVERERQEAAWLDEITQHLEEEDERSKSSDLPFPSREEPEQNVSSPFDLLEMRRLRTISNASVEAQDGQIAGVSQLFL